MSGTTIKKIKLTVLFLSLSGLLSFSAYFNVDKNRTPVAHKKHKYLRATHKISIPLKVHITSDTKNATPGEPFTLTGHVNTHKQLKNVHISWALPKGVELLKGSLDYFVNEVSKNNPHSSELVLVSTVEKNLRIHFRAKGRGHYSATAQYNTTLQTQINREIANIKASHKKYVNGHL